MKLSFCLLLLSFFQMTIVRADDSVIFNYTGDLGVKFFKLQSAKTHTEFTTEIEKYKCNSAADSTDNSICERKIHLPYEVIDYDVTTNISVKFAAAPVSDLNEGFSINQSGDKLSVTGVSSGELILKAMPVITSEVENKKTDQVTKDIDYKISFEEANVVLAPVKGGLKNQMIEGKMLSFEVGDLSNPETFDLRLMVERKKVFLQKSILLDRSLEPSDYQTVDLGNGRNKVMIDLSKLVGNIDSSKTHTFRFSLGLKHNFDHVVNMSQLGATKIGDSITINE